MAERGLVPLLAALRDWGAWLESERVEGIVIGGVAVSLLTRPRFTRDVDAWFGFLRRAGPDLSMREHDTATSLADPML